MFLPHGCPSKIKRGANAERIPGVADNTTHMRAGLPSKTLEPTGFAIVLIIEHSRAPHNHVLVGAKICSDVSKSCKFFWLIDLYQPLCEPVNHFVKVVRLLSFLRKRSALVGFENREFVVGNGFLKNEKLIPHG